MYLFIWILTAYLAFSVFYILFFSLSSLFYRNKKKSDKYDQKKNRIAIFIPGYKEDQVIIDTAHNVLEQRYPAHLFDVFILADSFSPKTLEALKRIPVKVIEMIFDKSTKAKSLNRALEILPGDAYEIALVLDADNHLEPGFLKKINAAFNQGQKVMQGHRTAKNLNTNFAYLDAISEEINNSIFRKGHQSWGLSSALIGSGMAFSYGLYKRYMNQINAISGFDKEMEMRLLEDGVRIHYLNDALVYDEKIQNAQTFEKQRTRWLAAQIKFAGDAFKKSLYLLFRRGNVDLFNKALQWVMPPRLILLGLLFIMIPLGWFLDTSLGFTYLALFGSFVLALMLAIPGFLFRNRLLWAILDIPEAFFKMLMSLLKFREAQNKFIHTPHDVNHKSSGL